MYPGVSLYPSPGYSSSYDRLAAGGPYQPGQANQGYFNSPGYNYQPQPQSQTNITFVNGIEGAKAFQLNPNSSFLMMDADNSKFYVKTSDSLGVAKITSYSFTEDSFLGENRVISEPQTATPEAGLQEAVTTLQENLADLSRRFEDLASKLGE